MEDFRITKTLQWTRDTVVGKTPVDILVGKEGGRTRSLELIFSDGTGLLLNAVNSKQEPIFAQHVFGDLQRLLNIPLAEVRAEQHNIAAPLDIFPVGKIELVQGVTHIRAGGIEVAVVWDGEIVVDK